MYIVVLLIHPRKGLNVFAVTLYSRITVKIHKLHRKSIAMLYKLDNLHNCHQKFIYIIVLPIMNLCQIRCKDCPYFVCVHLSLDYYSACWEVKNFAFHAGKHIPGFLVAGG